MKKSIYMLAVLVCWMCPSLARAQNLPDGKSSRSPSSEMPAEYKQVLDALGKQGDFKDGVLKVNIPRSDLKVTVDGIATPTPFGFGGWVALEKGTGGMNVLMGDLVLTEAEVSPVMSALLMGAVINARMGLNTWAAFYGSDADAVVAGNVAMLDGEVQPVLKALRGNGIDVVAIHHHMIGTSPSVIFLHYWGRGAAQKLATGVRAAVDQLGKSAR